MAIALISSIILQFTVYSNVLVKYFDKILHNDASHFTKGGKPIDFNTEVKNKLVDPGKGEQIELKVVAPCRKLIILIFSS